MTDQNCHDGTDIPLPPATEVLTPPDTAAAQPPRMIHTVFEYVELFVLTVTVVLLATLFFFRHTYVDGPSMNTTLENGENLIISDIGYTPTAGDIVVFDIEETDGVYKSLIKRVIATAGQTVDICADGVRVNGVLLEESYAWLDGSNAFRNYLSYNSYYGCVPASYDENGEMIFRYTVGEGEVFVMGDNRFNSKDSRAFGVISEEYILGRVLFRVTPLSKFGGVS